MCLALQVVISCVIVSIGFVTPGVRSGQNGYSITRNTVDDFERSWLRFEVVAKAKDWDQAKQFAILPTLLHGKLLDHFVSLSDDDKKDAKKLKTVLINIRDTYWLTLRWLRECLGSECKAQ